MIRIFNQYVAAKSLLLVALECILITLSLLCAVKLRFWNEPAEFEAYLALPDFLLQALMVVGIFQICFYYNDLYDLAAVRRRSDQFIRIGQSLGAACLLLGLLYFLVPALVIGRGVFFITTFLVAFSVMPTRILLDTAWRVTGPVRNALILGSGGLAVSMARELRKREDLGITVIGFATEKPADFAPDGTLFGQRIVGGIADLESLVSRYQVSRIIVAMEDHRGALPVRDLVRLRVQGVIVEDWATAMAGLTGRVWLSSVRPSWFVFSDGFYRSRVTIALKRGIDLAVGLIGLVLSAPIMLLIALAVYLDSGRPILYRQLRVGLRGKCFEVLKFRTMRLDAEDSNGAQWAQEDDPRVTRLGRILRKFRLDELPQFVNVIRGDMSFVGPRPERPVFVDKLRTAIPYYDERHSVRPGITGWAQVQYPYGASVEDSFRKLEYDLFYLKNMSVLFDCAIIVQTVRIVFFGRGAR